jgi:hypothetical protein
MQQILQSHIGTDQVVASGGLSEAEEGTDADFHAVFAPADSLMYDNKKTLKSMGARAR